MHEGIIMNTKPDFTQLDETTIAIVAPLYDMTVDELRAEIENQKSADQRQEDIKSVKILADTVAKTFAETLETAKLETKRYLDIRIAFFVDIDKEGNVRTDAHGKSWLAETRVKDLTRKASASNGYQDARNGDGNGSKREVGDIIPTSSTNYKRICLNYLLTDGGYDGELPQESSAEKTWCKTQVGNIYAVESATAISEGLDPEKLPYLYRIHRLRFPDKYDVASSSL